MQKTSFRNHQVKRFSSQRSIRRKSDNQPTRVILFNKPYDALLQFTDEAGRRTLKEFIPVQGVYAAGRLDRDSEGLPVLTNNGVLQTRLTQPSKRTGKIYYVQVESTPTQDVLEALRNSVALNDGPTLLAGVELVEELAWLWPWNLPIHERKSTPTSWPKITLYEGRNRQVRRTTAHVGFPTLRLIRHVMGNYSLDNLANDEWREATDQGCKMFKPHVTAACVVHAEGKFLVVEEMINGKALRNQPAGHPEADETLVEAAARELWEETGISARPQHLTHMHQWVVPDKTSLLRFLFVIEPEQICPTQSRDSDIDCCRWVSAEGILQASNLCSPLVVESIRRYQSGQRYLSEMISDLNWPFTKGVI